MPGTQQMHPNARKQFDPNQGGNQGQVDQEHAMPSFGGQTYAVGTPVVTVPLPNIQQAIRELRLAVASITSLERQAQTIRDGIQNAFDRNVKTIDVFETRVLECQTKVSNTLLVFEQWEANAAPLGSGY